ncbi:unnamed protein product [Peniophora sp. CBMAI 1063]|nr:unnamed protein product [Peniophora sp. CBMAI 1063]
MARRHKYALISEPITGDHPFSPNAMGVFRRSETPQTPAILEEGWPPNVKTDEAAFAWWQQELREQRALYSQKPTLVAGRVLGGPFTIKQVPAVYDDALPRRAVPTCAKQAMEIEITLVHPLRETEPGDNRPCQTWLVRTTTDDVLVAKFYCAFFFVPSVMYCLSFAEYRLPHHCARTETMAYEALSSAQGRWLPYFLGRHEVKFGHGFAIDMILLEYIPGETLHAFRSEHHLLKGGGNYVQHDPEDTRYNTLSEDHFKWFSWIRTFVQEMHQSGITHGDLNTRNIILHQHVEPEGSYMLVIVDFEQARDDRLHGRELRVTTQGLVCCDKHARELAKRCNEEGIPITDWYVNWRGIHV